VNVGDLRRLLDNYDDDVLITFYDLNSDAIDVCPDSSIDSFNSNLSFLVNSG
jgi:hypothetical protein